jgi:hypothetical protein
MDFVGKTVGKTPIIASVTTLLPCLSASTFKQHLYIQLFRTKTSYPLYSAYRYIKRLIKVNRGQYSCQIRMFGTFVGKLLVKRNPFFCPIYIHLYIALMNSINLDGGKLCNA